MVPELLIGVCGLLGLNLWHRFEGLAGIAFCLCHVALTLAIAWALTKLHIKLKL